MKKANIGIVIILVIALAVRIIGINYGLPFKVVADETSTVYGALKMLEIKSLVPAFHDEQFTNALYYPPYGSYILLIPYAVTIGSNYLLSDKNIDLIALEYTSDPSIFYVIYRLTTVLFGVLSVYLVYLIGRKLFSNKNVGNLSALFLAISFIHSNFSHWGRHWVPVTFVFLLSFWVLLKDHWTDSRRYMTASTLLGIGVGINYQMAVAAFFILAWFLVYEKRKVSEAVKLKWVWYSFLIFILLGVLAYLLYPNGLVVESNDVVGVGKNIFGFLKGFLFYLHTLFVGDVALLAFTLVGGLILYKKHRRIFSSIFLFMFLYISFFYITFFHVDRYILMLLPLCSLVSGYGLNYLITHHTFFLRKIGKVLGIVFISFSVLVLINFNYLLLKNDTRVQTLEWVTRNIPRDSKIAILSEDMRIPGQAESVMELVAIDKNSLRSVDYAELELDNNNNYHSLNLATVRNKEFLNNLGDYLNENNYEYLVLEKKYENNINNYEFVRLNKVVYEINGYQNREQDIVNWFNGSISARDALPWFSRSPLYMFEVENLGPGISVIKIE